MFPEKERTSKPPDEAYLLAHRCDTTDGTLSCKTSDVNSIYGFLR